MFVISHFTPLEAQVVVEEVVTTDTVDIFAKLEEDSKQRKSPKLAMLANILVPGLGHQYIGNYSRAMGYFAAEALFVFGMVFCESYSKKLYGDSRSYAWMYAGTQSTKDVDDKYWKIIGNKYYMTYKEYNNEMNLIGAYEKKYVDVDELWAWSDESYRDAYNEIRNDATRFHVVSSFFLGAMLLNRAVSFIDVRIASKYATVQSRRTGIAIQPHYSFSVREVGVSLTSDF